ncbi:MAG: CopG family ribbon-helix-helix protein [Desulfurococcaceae archaeon]
MAGSRKKRFGVSIPAEVAEKLEELTSLAASDRSALVVRALEEYLHEEVHYDKEHSCSGLLILLGVGGQEVAGLVSAPVVKASCTARVGGELVTVLFVEGPYLEIKQLRKSLKKAFRVSRYVPLYCRFAPEARPSRG